MWVDRMPLLCGIYKYCICPFQAAVSLYILTLIATQSFTVVIAVGKRPFA